MLPTLIAGGLAQSPPCTPLPPVLSSAFLDALPALFPSLLPKNYVSIYLQSPSATTLTDLVVSLAPYALPWLVLAILFAVGWLACCFQFCCRGAVKCCQDKSYTKTGINCCACLTVFSSFFTIAFTVFVLIIAFDFRAALTNTTCYFYATSNSISVGEVSLTSPTSNFIGLGGSTPGAVATSFSLAMASLGTFVNGQVAAAQGNVSASTSLGTMQSSQTSICTTINTAYPTAAGPTTKYFNANWCTKLQSETTAANNARQALSSVNTAQTNLLGLSAQLPGFIAQFQSGTPLASAMNSLSANFDSITSVAKFTNRYTDLGVSLLFGILFGAVILLATFTLVSIMCPFSMDCFSCAWLLKMSWCLTALGALLTLLLTASIGGLFVLSANTSTTIPEIVKNPTAYSASTNALGSTVTTCLQNPTYTVFDLTGVAPAPSTTTIITNLKTISDNYQALSQFNHFNSSAFNYSTIVDSYLADPTLIPGTSAGQILSFVNCNPNYKFVFNPAFCNGKPLQDSNTIPASACVQVQTTASVFAAAPPIQPIPPPVYTGGATFTSITLAMASSMSCNSNFLTNTQNLNSFGLSAGAALASLYNNLISYQKNFLSFFQTLSQPISAQTKTMLGALATDGGRLSYGISCSYIPTKFTSAGTVLGNLGGRSLVLYIVLAIECVLLMLQTVVAFTMSSRLQMFERRHGNVQLIPLDLEEEHQLAKQLEVEMTEQEGGEYQPEEQ